MSESNEIRVLVSTSTFPRWTNDTVPCFVMELCKRLVNDSIKIDVIAPHAIGARNHEIMEGLNVHRYRYFFEKWELLAYGGGILPNIKNHKLLYLLIPFFILFQTVNTFILIYKNNYDVIHAHWLIPQGLICLLISKLFFKRKVKVLCTSHGGDLFSFQSILFRGIKKWILRSSRGITVVSEHMKNVCLALKGKNIYICPMGVDLINKFTPISAIKREPYNIIFVGRLVEKKGTVYLLEAIREVIKTYPNIKLNIIGDGPEKQELEKYCVELKVDSFVEFFGALSQEKLPAIYSSSSIAVMPSIIDSKNDQEGLGLVAVEAMGCECAVIASSLPAVKDIITNGVNGILVEPGNTKELTHAIIKLLEDTHNLKRIALNGRQSVIKKFDWNIVAKNYSNIIESVAKKD